MANVFEAARQSVCNICNKQIELKQRIAKNKNGYAHADCIWPKIDDANPVSTGRKSVEQPAEQGKTPAYSRIPPASPQLPLALSDRQINEFLEYAEKKATQKLRTGDYDDIQFVEYVKAIFNAKLQQQAQEYSILMNLAINAQKKQNIERVQKG